MGEDERRFSTGVRFLDEEVGGGIPAGDIVALTTPPDAQTEVLFTEIARVQPTQYVSTVCADEAELTEWITPAGEATNDIITVSHATPADLLSDPTTLVELVPSETCLIIDPVNLLEQGEQREYLALLDEIKARLRAVGSVGVLNCLETGTNPAHRPLTLKRADQVWQLNKRVDGGELTTTLLIAKARGNDVPQEAIDIELAEEVRIDTSRNIA